ncbi:immunoglobulin-like domain-containing protein [uncultured Sharpea sp.]|uniref:C40 family peptidase n=1 Tax=uncultured Sharpea sp. TaxID=1112738 RepID=UPI0025895CD1|nr:immunoglobulin-like domain-containing protein [uncultured Sharpea sp.]
MDREIASRLNVLINDKVMKRKAMFLPLFAISAFGVVGYAAADREAPKILSNKVQVLYGTNLSAKDFEITDNRDKAEDLDVKIDTTTFDKKQLGTYNVNVEAADQFNNTTSKVVEVEVVDKEAPVITPKNSGGYVIDVNANGSNKLEDYIKAVDNVDGDVTPFITADKELDTTKVGVQTINVTASDNAGNTTTKALQFAVSDKEAPTVSYKNGDHVTVAYGSQFNIADYLNIADNLDTNPKVETEGNVDTSKEGTYSIKAKVSDANGNSAQPVALTVEVKDITAPTITLSKSSVEFLEGSAFNARSYLSNASDNKDGDVTGKVQINSNVNASKAGSYTVTYTVSDNAGNKASNNLNVTVKAKAQPQSARGGVSGANVNGGGIIGTARSKLGAAYVFGASGSNVFDCSGFTSYVYRSNGKSLPRTAAAQYSATSRVSSPQPGDLVFFSNTYKPGISHVGIYIGGGQFIHAANERTGVTVSSLNSGYYASHYAGAGR